MTNDERAEKILSAVQYLRHADAVIYVATELERAFLQGRRSAFDEASQLIASWPNILEQERVS